MTSGSIYVDASVKEDAAGIGWYEGSNDNRWYGRLEESCSNTTAEMIAIRAAVENLLRNNRCNENITIWTDSISSIEKLRKPYIDKKEVWLCSEALNELAAVNDRVKLAWVSKKSGNLGLMEADRLARRGREKDDHLFCNGKSGTNNAAIIMEWEKREKRAVWGDIVRYDGFEMSKLMLKGFDDDRMERCATLDKKKIRTISALCTGAAPLNSFLRKIKKRDSNNRLVSDRCRLCFVHKEDMLHLLVGCQSVRAIKARVTAFGKRDIDKEELRTLDLKKLLLFAEEVDLYEMISIREQNLDNSANLNQD